MQLTNVKEFLVLNHGCNGRATFAALSLDFTGGGEVKRKLVKA